MFSSERFDDGDGVAHGDADAKGHDEGQIGDGAPPSFGVKDALRGEIETGNGAGGGEEERQVNEQHLKPALIEADDHRG